MTEKYTPELHARLRELHQQASPAPWKIASYSPHTQPNEPVKRVSHLVTPNGLIEEADKMGYDYGLNAPSAHDFLLIAELRNSLPAILDEIERLTEERKTAKAEAWKNGYADCLCDIEAVYEIDREAITHKTTDPYEEQE